MRMIQVWAALTLLLVGQAMAQEAAPKRRVPPLEVAVQVGFDHRSRGTLPGTWAPVTLWITNHTDKGTYGHLKLATVDTTGQPGGSKVSRQVALPAGVTTPVHSTVFIAPGDTRLDVQVIGGGGEIASVTDSLLAAPRLMRSIVVVGEAKRDPTVVSPTYPHDALARAGHDLRLSGVPVVGYPSEEWQYGDPVRWQVLAALSEDLPDRWVAYGGVSAIVIADPTAVETLSNDQWTAIVEFVRSGGQLVIEAAGTSAIAARASGRLQPLLPARVGATRTVEVSEVYAALQLSHATEGTMSLTELEPLPHSTTSRDHQLVPFANAPYGLGTVTVTGFSLADPAFAKDDDTLKSLTTRVLAIPHDDYERQASAANLLRQVDYQIKSEELAQIPSHRVLLAFLLAYCFCIGPVNRVLFGSARRPLRPWAVLPFIVLGFVGLAMNQLGIKRPEVPLLREITVLQARNGDSDALARSYLSLYSPHRATYRVDYARKGTAVQYLTHSEHRGLDRDTLSYSDGVGMDQIDPTASRTWAADQQGFRLDGLTLAPRSSANLAATQRVTLDGTIRIDPSGPGGNATITNGLKVPLAGAIWLAASGSQYELPPLRPGESKSITMSGSSKSLTDLIQRPGRDRRVLENLVTHLRNPASRPAVLAWTEGSLTGLKAVADGTAAQSSALTFFLIHPAKGDR